LPDFPIGTGPQVQFLRGRIAVEELDAPVHDDGLEILPVMQLVRVNGTVENFAKRCLISSGERKKGRVLVWKEVINGCRRCAGAFRDLIESDLVSALFQQKGFCCVEQGVEFRLTALADRFAMALLSPWLFVVLGSAGSRFRCWV
jgi:hypothetical protein